MSIRKRNFYVAFWKQILYSIIMKELKDLIREQRARTGKTFEQIGKEIGVAKATVQRWESGEIKDMRRDKLVALARALETTPAYLMGWEDSPTTDYTSIPGIEPMPNMRKIPLVGTIACGEPILAVENIEGEVEIPCNIHADFALRCKGDSMINARIFDGDVVYIREQPSVENGQIAAVLIDDEATLKRVRLFDDHISLEPENPMYRPIVYWNGDMNSVRILGLAVAFTSVVR